ncbi:glutaredoxin domain-containing cysteine-rich protein 2 [Tachyglossus aculeatus]|uniref:glutaredoxin domain-containing cysteine-rich protein 2 n=1 Tax=Tachyglossus aculeatus TaxID=9261 RepID=UPI0018F4E557|nr:glutaredoxin domain-containing cysteine-rich protein 2 [Tachyglossus aculeatus]
MEPLEEQLNQKGEARPRKVRFKISSSSSGRVLKQVFEDGQELDVPHIDSPPRCCLRPSFGPAGDFSEAETVPEPRLYSSAKLTAQRISVFREGDSYSLMGRDPLFHDFPASDLGDCPARDHRPAAILDFGKIIIYTKNLKIIRAPTGKRDLMRKILQKGEDAEDWSDRSPGKPDGCSEENQKCLLQTENPSSLNHYIQGEDGTQHSCFRCRGSGRAPCSLCHGSKFSTLANRFKESYRALRCPACNEEGLQPCQVCNQ